MNESDSCYGQEVELKLRVPSAEALQAIAKAAGGESLGTALQRNVFFDTPDFALHHARFGLRLRDEDGHFTVTAKSPETLSEDGTVASRGEAETRISSEVAARVAAGDVCPLDLLGAAGPGCAELVALIRERTGARPVQPVGGFDNVRQRQRVAIETPSGPVEITLECDATTFPNGEVHHELEIEIPSGLDAELVQRSLRSWLQTAEVEAKPSSSKAARFFAALTKI